MRVTSLVALVVILGGLGFLGWSWWTEQEWMMGPLRASAMTAKGYTQAKTPQQACDMFKKALKERDYYAASMYVTGDYSEQLRKVAKPASKLGTTIDNLVHNMEQEGVKSDEVFFILKFLEPLPTEVKLASLQYKDGDKQGLATFDVEKGKALDPNKSYFEEWKDIDWAITQALNRAGAANVGGAIWPTYLIPGRWNVVKVGEGDKAIWKVDIKVSDVLRQSVDNFKDKSSNYVRAIDKVKYEIKRDAATKSDLKRRLKEELQEAK